MMESILEKMQIPWIEASEIRYIITEMCMYKKELSLRRVSFRKEEKGWKAY